MVIILMIITLRIMIIITSHYDDTLLLKQGIERVIIQITDKTC